MNWIDVVARDRDRWHDLVSVVVNLQVPLNVRSILLTEDLLAFQEELCSLELVMS
jgi:hypothetical protein